MQNRKFKQLAIAAGLTAVSMMASAQLANPQAVQAQATAPVQAKVAPAAEMPASAYSLEEIQKLRAIKSRLETERDVAKLEAEIKDIKSGKKAGSSSASASSTASSGTNLAMPMPNFAQMMMANTASNVAVSAIYGSGKNLTAEISVGRAKVLGKAGTTLSNGETILSVETDHVVLGQGKKVRKVSPTTESGVPYSAPGMSAPSAMSGPGATPPMIQPFNPADLISTPAPIVSDVPLNVPAEKKADVM